MCLMALGQGLAEIFHLQKDVLNFCSRLFQVFIALMDLDSHRTQSVIYSVYFKICTRLHFLNDPTAVHFI